MEDSITTPCSLVQSAEKAKLTKEKLSRSWEVQPYRGKMLSLLFCNKSAQGKRLLSGFSALCQPNVPLQTVSVPSLAAHTPSERWQAGCSCIRIHYEGMLSRQNWEQHSSQFHIHCPRCYSVGLNMICVPCWVKHRPQTWRVLWQIWTFNAL